MRQFLCLCAYAAAAAETHVILHADNAKRAQPSLAALQEHAVTVVHRGGDIGEAARTAATTADTIILYDARHAPLQHTLAWNATITNAGACVEPCYASFARATVASVLQALALVIAK